ncbi:MAG: peptidylprolyl isomerase [Planctomycetota bacterium]|jgi:cyclophilin family peptidyl-prolyl cis-trans isomerase
MSDPLSAADAFIESSAIDKSQNGWRLRMPKPPMLEFDADKTYLWKIQTNHGEITVKLLPESAPNHVSSTIYLSRSGFYDDLKFHRVITQFMAQGGCPSGNGMGGPGYQYDGEFDPAQKHDRPGLLSMANAGPGTDGSQFFLTFVPTPWLDGKHTIFGEVIDGTDTLKALEERGSERGTPSEPLKMVSTTIEVQ